MRAVLPFPVVCSRPAYPMPARIHSSEIEKYDEHGDWIAVVLAIGDAHWHLATTVAVKPNDLVEIELRCRPPAAEIRLHGIVTSTLAAGGEPAPPFKRIAVVRILAIVDVPRSNWSSPDQDDPGPL